MKKEETLALEVKNVSMTFKSALRDVTVLSNIRFSLNQGEVIGIRGENGSGKTTLFNIIAGIEKPTSGDVIFQDLPGGKLNIGVVFQNYNSTLLPWLNVADNICIPLKIIGLNKNERKERLEKVLSKLKFERLPLKDYPHELSGGQKQKVAIARGLIREPKILLLDEPFSNLDFQTSIDLQEVIQNIKIFDKTSIIVVSHDIDHILFLADRVLILSGHPSTISKEFNVNFSRPGKINILFSEEFESLRNEILEYEYSIFQNG